eukprot:COSAG01_NODE_10709_length_2097_cov_1.943443_1_plen_270_part_00
MMPRRLQRLSAHLKGSGGGSRPSDPGEAEPLPHAFGVDDAQALKSIGGLALSPCGGWVAYTVSENDRQEDREVSSLWLASTADDRAAGAGVPIRMSAPGLGASSPEFSPDGTMLCFCAARPIPPVVSGLDETLSTTQVWTHRLGPPPAGGDAQPLTFVKQGIKAFSWSPDLERPRLLLTIADPAPDADADEKERRKPKPWVMQRQQVRFYGAMRSVACLHVSARCAAGLACVRACVRISLSQFKRDYVGYLHNRRGQNHLYVHEGGQLR